MHQPDAGMHEGEFFNGYEGEGEGMKEKRKDMKEIFLNVC
jgi:hypothetical protein